MPRSIRRVRLGLLLGLLASGGAWAQQAVQTYSVPTTTAGGNNSGVIAATNGFQLVFNGNAGGPGIPVRNGCTLVNNGAHNMYVSEGITQGFQIGKALQLGPGAFYYCTVGGATLQGAIYIAGTAGDGFYAAQY